MIINPQSTQNITTIIQQTSIGLDGESGEDGFSIPGSPGVQGSSGPQGPPGVSIFVEDGLSGDDGFPGVIGRDGINGTSGADGSPGINGEDGISDEDLWPGFNPFRDDPLEQISRIQDQNVYILPNYSAIVIGPYKINSGKKLVIGSGGRFKIEKGAPSSSVGASSVPSGIFTTQIIVNDPTPLNFPTVPLALLPAQGDRSVIIPLFLTIEIETSTGAYGNDGGGVTKVFWANQSGSPIMTQTALSSILTVSQANSFAIDIPIHQAIIASNSKFQNQPLMFLYDNSGANLTGGNVNQWVFTLVYAKISFII